MTDEDAKVDEVVEVVAEPVVEPEASATVEPDPEPIPAQPGVVIPALRDEDRAYFRQWLRQDVRWIATELELHQTSVPTEDRPLRNP
jgi:hypothetical protein